MSIYSFDTGIAHTDTADRVNAHRERANNVASVLHKKTYDFKFIGKRP